MATKKLTPVTRTSAKKADEKTTVTKSSEVFDQSLLLEELKKQTEYMHKIDWKLWMIMNMVQIIGEENGYRFKMYQSPQEQVKENYDE